MLVFGFNGQAFMGSAHLAGSRTVEGAIVESIEAMGIREHYREDSLHKTLSRPSRVDRYVSASQFNVVMKFPDAWNRQFLLQEMPKHLPSDICLFDVIPVARRFNAQDNCDKRTYQYYLPLSMLKPYHSYSET